MTVGKLSQSFDVVQGVRLAAVNCGLKSDGSLDLVLFEFSTGSKTAGVFTKSLFAAAPVEICRKNLSQADSRYFLINSGNANAGVGKAGLVAASACCDALAVKTGVQVMQVLPFSTGVIGESLDVAKLVSGMDDLLEQLNEENWLLAAKGIMTTDTEAKIASRQFELDGQQVNITGIAKGAGMIQPNMATMLSYICTDVTVSQALLAELLKDAVEQSFNRITVDSDTSTNDSCMLTATAQVDVDLDMSAEARGMFAVQLNSLAKQLAHSIIRDAEGATKFVEVQVRGGKSSQECLSVAYAVANSPLMKTALYASDANWGRIVMAVGKADVSIDINNLDIYLGEVQLMQAGQKDAAYTEAAGAAVVAREEICIRIDINEGDYVESVWTSDLSHDYVTINTEYRT